MELNRRLRQSIGLLATGLLLYGCGGGGGDGGGDSDDDGSAPPEPRYQVSGAIRSAVGAAVDSDVNDPAAPFGSNNTADTAQPIPSTMILGGYANLPGAGAPGRSFNRGDRDDWYRVNLKAAQIITLSIAGDGQFNDLDLELRNAAGQLIDASRGAEKFETLTVRQDGDYFIRVQAYSGASNYNLALAQPTEAGAAGQTVGRLFGAAGCTRLSDAFVAGEAIVRFKDDDGTPAAGPQARAQALGLKAKGGAEGRHMLFSLAELDRASLYRTLGIAAAGEPGDDHGGDPGLQRKNDTLLAVKALRQRADVRYAEPNCLRYASFAPNDPFYDPQQWHYLLIDLPQAWDLAQGDGVIVAVVDTGVVLKHPDLRGRLVEGYDFIRDPDRAADGDGLDPDPDDPGDRLGPSQSSSFHGTHVAGSIAAATNNNVGVAGVAFNARIMPLRALGRGGAGTLYDIEQAIRYAAGLDNDAGAEPERRADIINLSLGGPGSSAAEEDVYRRVKEAGVVIVAAAGNESSDFPPSYPAAYDDVIAVSAVTITKGLAYYSNYGSYIDAAAPGGDTRLDINGDGQPDGVLSTAAIESSDGAIQPAYLSYQGTSMASPHMAGAMALMLSANPDLTPADIDNLLAAGKLTSDLGQAGRDDVFGHGLIDAYRAVVAALEAGGVPVPPTPIISVNPAGLNFGLFIDRIRINVGNGGGGELRLDAIADNADWLTVTATPSVAADGLGDYDVRVDRADLPDGAYTAKITFSSLAANSAFTAPVIMEASNLGFGDVGALYVLVIDAVTNETVQSAPVESDGNGVYNYRIGDVPRGTYKIVAGADMDNDGFICDPGEACGAYLTEDRPIALELDGDRSGLNFAVGFPAGIEDETTAAGAAAPQSRPGAAKRFGTARQ